jgi:acetylornithine deacetylase/succinyl-diaminopimelate desuccinylase-like protein
VKKIIIGALLFGLSLEAAESLKFSKSDVKVTSISSVRRLVDKIKRDDLIKQLHEFVKAGRPNRFPGNPGHQGARDFLQQSLKALPSGTTTVEEFSPDIAHATSLYKGDFEREVEGKHPPTSPIYRLWKGFTDGMVSTLESMKEIKGQNIVWEKKGYISPDEVIIIGAHYDTIANDKTTLLLQKDGEMPGADDNGSGVLIALNLARLLSHLELPKTVRIVFFDFEETGFLGSRAYVAAHKEDLGKLKFAGYVNLEMLGNDTRLSDSDKKEGNMRAYIRKEDEQGHSSDSALVNRLIKVGDKVESGVNFTAVSNSFNSSDHINFWEAGLPAVTFTQNWEGDFNEKRYHTANDFPETLNYKTWHFSFRYIAGGILGWCFDIL